MPNNFGVDDREVNAFLEKFREYTKYNSREIPELLVKQAKEFTEECFLLTPRADAGAIISKVQGISPVFKRAPEGFAKKIAASDSTVNDPATKAARKVRKEEADKLFAGATRRHKESRKKFIQRVHSERPEQAKRFTNSIRLTLAEQVKAAIIFRTRHIGSVAASWLNAMRKLGSKMRAAKANPNKIYSDVLIVDGGNPSVTIANKAPGIAKMAQKTGFVNQAFRNRVKDIQVYIDRKKSELVTIFNRTGSR